MKLEKVKKHDDEGNAYEYVVKQKLIGKFKARRILFWISCVSLVILWFVFGALTKLWVLLCLIPLSIWVFYFFVYPYTAREYKYVLESNTITYYTMYGERLEGKEFSLPIREFESICPYTDEYRHLISDFAPTVTYDGLSCEDAPDAYFALFTKDDGSRCLFKFEPTEKALKTLKYYNANTVVIDVKH